MLRGESSVRLYTTDDPPRQLAVPAVHCREFDAAAAIGKPLATSTDRSRSVGLRRRE